MPNKEKPLPWEKDAPAIFPEPEPKPDKPKEPKPK